MPTRQITNINLVDTVIVCLVVLCLFGVNSIFADNPLIQDQFTADPTARVFEGKIYIFPSHDIHAAPGRGREGWFVMEDYHVFSSDNLIDWKDHGVILDQKQVPWLEKQSFDMWAPDCYCKNGKYYFYFPTGRRIGVAVADKPYGQFKPEKLPIDGARGIDPCVLIDKDGQAYIYYSMNKIFAAKLKDNMLELESEPIVINNLPQKGLIEGPFVFERNGIYYLTYPHVQNKTERLEYAVSTSPLGPFEHKGVIMDESVSGCWTNHHSIVEYNGQWYLFYHDKDLSPDFDKNRAIRADYLTFNSDDTIQKVVPTLRGVGICPAVNEIQIDRYSAISDKGVSVEFNDINNTFAGWKAVLNSADAWIRYDRVDFGKKNFSKVTIKACSETGGIVNILKNDVNGPMITQVEIPKKSNMSVINLKTKLNISGLNNLVILLKDNSNVEIDWIKFEE